MSTNYPRKDFDQIEAEKLAERHGRRGTEMQKPSTGFGGAGNINVSGLGHSITSIDERNERQKLTGEKPTRDRTTSGQGRSPGGRHSSAKKGGGNSAERLRKGDNDAYEDRIDEMHHNIGKWNCEMLITAILRIV